ncbi:LysR family transcriptional regulator substrate-binding protein [Fournierella massiliensis]|nr:LysR family transcriptional regulator substrate-binding protein [Fournierella massiliensis]
MSFEQFCRQPQIMLEHGSNLRSTMDQIFAQRDVIPQIVLEVRECNAALQYVGLGFGVSVLPYVPAMESDKVAVLPIAD